MDGWGGICFEYLRLNLTSWCRQQANIQALGSGRKFVRNITKQAVLRTGSWQTNRKLPTAGCNWEISDHMTANHMIINAARHLKPPKKRR